MEAPFFYGQRIIRIGETKESNDKIAVLTKGYVYTCAGCFKCKCGVWKVLIKEFPTHADGKATCKCGHITRSLKYYVGLANKFAPIEYKDVTAEIAAGVTETKEQPDQQIIPAKPETAPCENTFS